MTTGTIQLLMTTISSWETFIRDFLVITKESLIGTITIRTYVFNITKACYPLRYESLWKC